MEIDELESIGENSGAVADPVEGHEGADANDDTNTSGDGGADNPDTNQQGNEGADDSDEGTDGADSSKPDGKGEQPKPEDKTQTKAKKEEARRDKSWKKLEEEKAQLLREKAEFEAAKLNASNPQNANAQANPTSDPSALAASFEKMAEQYEEAGDFDKADEARRKAAALRAHAQQNQTVGGVAPTTAHPSENPQFKVAWNANMERAINEFPEMKDPNSDFGQTVQKLLRAPDSAEYFTGRPDGILVAAQLTNLKMTALKVPTLEKENATLREEIKKLRQGMGIPETGAHARSGEARSFESMTTKEQEAYLRKQAEEADASTSNIM